MKVQSKSIISRYVLSYSQWVNVWGKRFKLPQLKHESFLTLHHSCKIFFWYLPNWTSTDLWCVVLYVAYSTTHQRFVEVQFGRYQKNIFQEWSMVENLSCVSCAAWNVFPINSLMSRNHTKLCFLRKIFSLKSKTSPTSQRPHLVYVSMHILVVLAAKPKFMDEDDGVYREKNV